MLVNYWPHEDNFDNQFSAILHVEGEETTKGTLPLFLIVPEACTNANASHLTLANISTLGIPATLCCLHDLK